MPGFDNNVVYANNVDFSGNSPVTAQVLLDGQLLIGSSVAPHIRVSTLNSSDGSITITNSNGHIDLVSASGGAGTITGNDLVALSQTANNWNIIGSGSITTSGLGSTLTTQLTGLTDHAVLVGAGTTTITKLAIGATNQVLLGNTAADPSWGTVSNAALTNSSVTLNSGNNITVTGGGPLSLGGVASFNLTGTTNHAIQLGNATGSLTSLSTGSTGQVLQANTGADPTWSTATFPSTATGTGTLLRADGTNWVATTSTYPNTNAISTLLYASSANVMSALATANNGLLVTSSGGVPSILAGPGTTGNILQSNAAAAPSFSTATYPSTATGTGKVLIADGTNWVASTPTFPNASATSRKIIVSDGTNWVASTETYAVPGTSGNVLTSDGTNWTSATPSSSSSFLIATKTLTSAQIKAINATPIEVIAAPGSGLGIVIVSVSWKFTYGGTNVFVAAASQTISLRFNNNTTAIFGTAMIPNSVIVGNATKFTMNSSFSNLTNQVAGVLDNVNVAAWNPIATEISGNAANNNTIDIIVGYYLITY